MNFFLAKDIFVGMLNTVQVKGSLKALLINC